MSVMRAHVPMRLRVDAASLVERESEIESGLTSALGRALDRVSVTLAEAGVADGPVQVHPPEVVWSGAGLAQLPVEVRKQFELRITGILAQQAKGVQLAASGPLATGQRTASVSVGGAVTGGETSLPFAGAGPARTRDHRLQEALELIRRVRARHPEPLAAPDEVLEELRMATGRLDPHEPENLATIAREVQRLFPSEILVPFLARIEERDSWRQRELRGITGMSPPGLLLPHILLAPGGVTGIDTERLANAIATVEGFLGGVLEGFREEVGPQKLELLAHRAGWSATFSAVFPPVFIAGAGVGIVQDLWESIKGVVELVANFSRIVKAADEMLDIVFSPQGKDVGALLGLGVGRAYAKDVEELLAQNFILFTFNLGRKVGPALVYAIASLAGLLGLPPVAAAGLAARLLPILKRVAPRFQRLAAMVPGTKKLPIPDAPDVKLPPTHHLHAGETNSAGLEKVVEEQLAKHLPDETLPAVASKPDPDVTKISGEGEVEFGPAPAQAPEGLTSPEVKGGKDPRIEGRRVPHREAGELRPNVLDMQDIRLLPGENVGEAVARVNRVITQQISHHKPVADAWNAARKHVLGKRPFSSVTRAEMLGKAPWKQSLYDRVRDRFWHHEVPDSSAAQKVFADAGFDVSQRKAPMLITDGKRPLPDWERRISLDHSHEKALANNWEKAIDAENLVFEFQAANSWREIIQVRHRMRDVLGPEWIEVPIGTPFPKPLE